MQTISSDSEDRGGAGIVKPREDYNTQRQSLAIVKEQNQG